MHDACVSLSPLYTHHGPSLSIQCIHSSHPHLFPSLKLKKSDSFFFSNTIRTSPLSLTPCESFLFLLPRSDHTLLSHFKNRTSLLSPCFHRFPSSHMLASFFPTRCNSHVIFPSFHTHARTLLTPRPHSFGLHPSKHTGSFILQGTSESSPRKALKYFSKLPLGYS